MANKYKVVFECDECFTEYSFEDRKSECCGQPLKQNFHCEVCDSQHEMKVQAEQCCTDKIPDPVEQIIDEVADDLLKADIERISNMGPDDFGGSDYPDIRLGDEQFVHMPIREAAMNCEKVFPTAKAEIKPPKMKSRPIIEKIYRERPRPKATGPQIQRQTANAKRVKKEPDPECPNCGLAQKLGKVAHCEHCMKNE